LGVDEKNQYLMNFAICFLKKPIIAGGFIYMTDLFNNPNVVSNIAKVISSEFSEVN